MASEISLEVSDHFQPRTDLAFLERVVAATLAHADRDMHVSLLLTDDTEIARLHGEYLDDPTPTDVMCFPQHDGEESHVDIVVSVECARREASRRRHSFEAELALYVVHGLLHACGYDDVKPSERRCMREAEQLVLHTLGYEVECVDDEAPNDRV